MLGFLAGSMSPVTTNCISCSSIVFNAVCNSTDLSLKFYITGNDIAVNATVYKNSGLSTIFVGNGGYYRIDDSGFQQAAQINSLGEITSLSLCP